MATMKAATLWSDPRTGIWTLRRRVPNKYLAVAGVKGGIVKISTGTADRKAAERKLPDVLECWQAMQDQWEASLHAVPLDPAGADRIAAAWSAALAEGKVTLRDLSLSPGAFDMSSTPPWRKLDQLLPDARALLDHHADEALRIGETGATAETRDLLLRAMLDPVRLAYVNARPTVGLERPTADMAAKRAPASLTALYDAWKAVAAVSPQYAVETKATVDLVAKFLGHDDAARITKADLVRWRDSLTGAGLVNRTVNNRLVKLHAVFDRAVRDEKLPHDPTNGLRLEPGKVNSPKPYSDPQAAVLLSAARVEAAPIGRWPHWIMCFTGARVMEVLQLRGCDVRQDGDLWLIDINDDDGKSVKTGKRRNVPVHPALLAEGFIDFARTVAPDAPLFAGLKGRNSATNIVARQARAAVPDPACAPSHSWRHRMEDELRAVECPEDVRDAILGHGRKTVGASYGVRGEALSRLYRYLEKVPLPRGV
jgi:integrase